MLGLAFILACLNPWASFGVNDLDSQPWPLAAAVLFLFSVLTKLRAPPYFVPLMLSLLIGVLFASFTPPIEGGAPRAVISYLTILACYLAAFNYFRLYGFPTRTFIVMNVIWVAVGVIELYTPALSQFISQNRTTSDRGVTSMSPEPTHFGVFLFFISWVMLAAYSFRPPRKIALLCIANVAAIFLLAKATMVIGLVVFALGVAAVASLAKWVSTAGKVQGRMMLLVGGSLLAVLAVAGVDAMFPESRVSRVFDRLMGGGLYDLLMADASINQRLEAVVYSIHGFFFNWMAPGGFDSFLNTRDALWVVWGDYFWFPTQTNKIMSWIGGILYELGIFGAVVVLCLFAGAKKAGVRLREIVIVAAVLLTAIPPAFPLAPMLFALWCAKGLAYRRAPLPPSTAVGSSWSRLTR